MTERYERLFAYGAPPVDYHSPETWPDAVRTLYKRLQDKDCFVLADLLKWDIEFLTDRRAITTIVLLKYSPDLPDKKARAELRRIANVIRMRPSRSRRRLPYGDQLAAELESLSKVIEEHELLKVKMDQKAIQTRLADAMRNPMLESSEERTGALVSAMTEEQLLGITAERPARREGVSPKPRRESPNEETVRLASLMVRVARQYKIRKPRSWALQTLAALYYTGAKQIEEAIKRETRAGRRRGQPRPDPSTPQ